MNSRKKCQHNFDKKKIVFLMCWRGCSTEHPGRAWLRKLAWWFLAGRRSTKLPCAVEHARLLVDLCKSWKLSAQAGLPDQIRTSILQFFTLLLVSSNSLLVSHLFLVREPPMDFKLSHLPTKPTKVPFTIIKYIFGLNKVTNAITCTKYAIKPH